MKRFSFLIVLLYLAQYAGAQGIKISTVKEAVSGSAAFNAPADHNGNPAGLVKVSSTLSDITFEGDIVGQVDYQMNEYNVFLAKGSKQLVVKRPNVLPVTVNFPEYGIEEVASKATYAVTMKDVSINTSKNGLLIDVSPRDANVYIDDVPVSEPGSDGGYRFYLPKGEHICKVEAPGYRSGVYVVSIGKGTQSITAALESLMAEVEIHCPTSAVDILIDGEKVALGSWKGRLPAGRYRIEAMKEGYVGRSLDVTLQEKENRSVSIPELVRAKGNLAVQTTPKGAEVFLDGSKVDNYADIREVLTGKHLLKASMPFGYKEAETEVVVQAGETNTVQIALDPINDTYAKAFAGNVKAQVLLCRQKMESAMSIERDSIERNYWYEILYEKLDSLGKEDFELLCLSYWNQDISKDFPTYYMNDKDKRIRILLRWNEFLTYSQTDKHDVVWDIVNYYLEKQDFEKVLEWSAEGIEIPQLDYDGFHLYDYLDIIAEICVENGDIKKAEDIVKNHYLKHWPEAFDYGYRWESIYYAIGNAYKLRGDCDNAVTYYRKYQQSNPQGYMADAVKKHIQECSNSK